MPASRMPLVHMALGCAAAMWLLAGAARADGPPGECEVPGLDRAARLACLSRALAALDAEMTAALEDARFEAKVADAMVGAEEAGARLAEAQRAWVAYRDAECALTGSLTLPREDRTLRALSCRIALTERRRDELRALRAAVTRDDCGCTARHQNLLRHRLRRTEPPPETPGDP